MRGIAKTNFSQKLEFVCFQGPLLTFFGGLGRLFVIFDALETGLKFNGFSGLPSGTPELRERALVMVTGLFPGAVKSMFNKPYGLNQQGFKQ